MDLEWASLSYKEFLINCPCQESKPSRCIYRQTLYHVCKSRLLPEGSGSVLYIHSLVTIIMLINVKIYGHDIIHVQLS